MAPFKGALLTSRPRGSMPPVTGALPSTSAASDIITKRIDNVARRMYRYEEIENRKHPRRSQHHCASGWGWITKSIDIRILT
eukprot:7996209-Pyramimonas_sp.AAC.1